MFIDIPEFDLKIGDIVYPAQAHPDGEIGMVFSKIMVEGVESKYPYGVEWKYGGLGGTSKHGYYNPHYFTIPPESKDVH